MPKKRAKTPAKQILRETLTTQRLSVLSWAGAATLFACVGLASLQFGQFGSLTGGLSSFNATPLPPVGPVATTASVPERSGNPQLGVYPSNGGRMITGTDELAQGQMETLRLEIIALRRRLGALAEQNLVYSQRIAALEEEVRRIGNPDTTEPVANAKNTDPAPKPGIVSGSPSTVGDPTADAAATAEDANPNIRDRIEAVPAPETLSRAEQKSLEQAITDRAANVPVPQHQPVRILALADTGTEPVTTGSIPNEPAAELQPEETLLPSRIIEPSAPAGRIGGAGSGQISRATFGAVVGRFDNPEQAVGAWTTFVEQNEERMRDLRPLLAEDDLTGGVKLLAGPFGNAADVAVACLRLLEVTETCHPELYAGNALPELAQAGN